VLSYHATRSSGSEEEKSKFGGQFVSLSAGSGSGSGSGSGDGAQESCAKALRDVLADNTANRWRKQMSLAPATTTPTAGDADPLTVLPLALSRVAVSKNQEFAASVVCQLARDWLRGFAKQFARKTDRLYSPLFFAASLADPNTGSSAASKLADVGQSRCLAGVAECFGRTVDQVTTAAEAKDYYGPVMLFTEGWRCIELLGEQKNEAAVWEDPRFFDILISLKSFYAPLPISNFYAEELVKHAKHALPAQRRDEVALTRIIRAQIDPERCLFPVLTPRLVTQTDARSVWASIGGDAVTKELDDEPELPLELRLAQAQNNPDHRAHRAMSQSDWSAANKSLGFNKKRSKEQAAQERAAVQKPFTGLSSHRAAMLRRFQIKARPSSDDDMEDHDEDDTVVRKKQYQKRRVKPPTGSNKDEKFER
jgi:hypothetical protein